MNDAERGVLRFNGLSGPVAQLVEQGTFNPKVAGSIPARPIELRWLGRLLPGLFDGEHSLRIEPLDGGRSRFVQSERFTGLLVGLVKGTLAKTEVGFEQMNAALKARVEQASAQS